MLAVAIVAIIVLIVLHELGHFGFAKLFRVKVEEFGIGIPPRVIGKKIGETVYSLNLLPLGAFVRMEGEEQRSPGPRSFSGKPVWQRFLIVAAGVAAFWIIGAAILGILGATAGIPTAISDEEVAVRDPEIRILDTVPGSPAAKAGILPGDRITAVAGPGEAPRQVNTVGAVQEASEEQAEQELTLSILRGQESLEVSLVPRRDPPPGEGAMGVALARVGLLHFSPWEAPWQSVVLTWRITGAIVVALGDLAETLVTGSDLPPGTEVRGPIGIVELAQSTAELGAASFAYFIALIAIHLAVFNALPVPALDGGRMFFLALEWVRGRPLPEAVEKRSIAVSFGALILLIIAVSALDISRLF